MIEPILNELHPIVKNELIRAKQKHGDIYIDNNHGYGVLAEELVEAKDEMTKIEVSFEFLLNDIIYDQYTENIRSRIEKIRGTALRAAAECVQIAAVCEKWLASELFQ